MPVAKHPASLLLLVIYSTRYSDFSFCILCSSQCKIIYNCDLDPKVPAPNTMKNKSLFMLVMEASGHVTTQQKL